MTNATMALAEKGPDVDMLRQMVQFAAQRLMNMEAETLCGAGYDGKNPELSARAGSESAGGSILAGNTGQGEPNRTASEWAAAGRLATRAPQAKATRAPGRSLVWWLNGTKPSAGGKKRNYIHRYIRFKEKGSATISIVADP